MDCIKSNRIQTWKSNALRSHMGMLLLLSFAICIPRAVGSGHERRFELRGRGLVSVFPFTPPPAKFPYESAPPPSATVVAPVSLTPPSVSPPPSVPPPPPKYLAPSVSPPPSVSPAPLKYLPPLSSPTPPILTPPAPLPPSIPLPPPTSGLPSSPPLDPPLPPPPPPPSTVVNPAGTWNESEKAGVVIAAIAGLLQVAVVAFLLIKRHQMLTTVEYEDFDDEYDNPDHRHPEDSA